jgi:hypothetical protein
MIKMMKRNFRSLVFLLLIAVAAVGLFGGFSSGGLATGQSNKQSRAARKKTDSTNNQSSRPSRNLPLCKKCDDMLKACLEDDYLRGYQSICRDPDSDPGMTNPWEKKASREGYRIRECYDACKRQKHETRRRH